MTFTSMTICPLCGGSNLISKDVLKVENINELYKKNFNIEPLTGDNISYNMCTACCLVFFEPMVAGDASLYESLQENDWYYMEDKWEYDAALKYVPKDGTMLEVGAGKAEFSSKIQNIEYVGLEFNDKAILKAKQKNITLLKESIEEHAKSKPNYDVIVTFQVLEHVSDPHTFLKACVDSLKPGGTFIVGVPSHDGPLSKAVNHVLDLPPHHLSHWRAKTFESASRIFGVSLESVEYEPVSLQHVTMIKKTLIESFIRKMLFFPRTLIDVTFVGRVISKISYILAKFMPINMNGVSGHTMIAVFKKYE